MTVNRSQYDAKSKRQEVKRIGKTCKRFEKTTNALLGFHWLQNYILLKTVLGLNKIYTIQELICRNV